jgi:biopolymer transport protein ExbB
MKKYVNVIVIVLSIAVGYSIYFLILGNPGNFLDPALKHEPKPGNLLGTIYTGGPLVGLLISLVIIAIAFVFERYFSINKAQGKDNPEAFIKAVISSLEKGDLKSAIEICDSQRGSIANILRAGINRFIEIENDPEFPGEKKLTEVQRAIDEAMNLETPLLEKNLVVLSTIASISTMVGLLGTTLGMIRAFQALAVSGTVSAIQLSIGISEALYNTAGGLSAAIISIVAYNFFTTKVDNFVYAIDEAVLDIMAIFTLRTKTK